MAPDNATQTDNATQNNADLLRQNDYLKLRNAQLQDDVANLSAENERLRQEMERIAGRRTARAAPNPLGSGQ